MCQSDIYAQNTSKINKNISHKSILKDYTFIQGAIVRGDTSQRAMSIIFTGDTYAEGAPHIIKILRQNKIKASFFFTGSFYRNQNNETYIRQLLKDEHYLGAHSDKHLLYCDWTKRDSLLLTKKEFLRDLHANYEIMEKFGIQPFEARLFLPPYEWYNDKISEWTKEAGFQLINFSHGTLSNADYTIPAMKNYRSSKEIWESIINYETGSSAGFNGFILLMHIGTAAEREDKFYHQLEDLILWLKNKGYTIKRIDDLLPLSKSKIKN